MQDYVKKVFFEYIPSNSGLKKAILKGQILVNKKTTSTGTWIKKGMVLELLETHSLPPKPFHFKLDIIYEDDYLAVIYKPAGLTVSGNQYKTVVNALQYNLKPSSEIDTLPWPLPVHRLDNQTSGLLVIAKTKKAQIHLSEQFENKTIVKTYNAIVIGRPSKEKINTPINNQEAETELSILETVNSLKNNCLSLVELRPKTGRTHQLRIHLSSTGHPIFGDKIYGNKGQIFKGKGLFLCALAIQFTHPINNKNLSFEIELPHKFKSLLTREERRWKAT